MLLAQAPGWPGCMEKSIVVHCNPALANGNQAEHCEKHSTTSCSTSQPEIVRLQLCSSVSQHAFHVSLQERLLPQALSQARSLLHSQ